MRNPGLRDKLGNPCLYSGAPSSVVDIMDAFVQAIKQYPGQQQVDLKVRVNVPGSWFGAGAEGTLNAAETYRTVAHQ